MKKLLSIVLCLSLCLAFFAGCGEKETLSLLDGGEQINIAVLQYEETDNTLNAKDGLKKGFEENGVLDRINFNYQNAEGNIENLEKICVDSFKNSDVVITIGEIASITAARKRENIEIPIFFIGVENPVTSSLMTNIITPSQNITGVTSNVTPDCIFSFAAELLGGRLKKVGIIYNTSEINASYEVNGLQDYLNSNSIKFFEGVIANVFDAQQAVLKILANEVLIPTADKENPRIAPTAFFISSDNVTRKSIDGIADMIKGSGSIALVTSDVELPNDSFYRITPSYLSLGEKGANLVYDYISGVEIFDISTTTSDEYELFQGEIKEDDDALETEVIQQVEDNQEEIVE